MKINLITIGKPKLDYAKIGFDLYLKRLKYYHEVNLIIINDSKANEKSIQKIVSNKFLIVLDIKGQILSSDQLAKMLIKFEYQQKEIYFIIGGPNGLPPSIINQAQFKWSLSNLTFPHDMAIILVTEALFRASTINLNLPYHK